MRLADLRLLARVAALVGLALLCVPLHYLSRWTTGGSNWPRRFLGWAARACGARWRVEGEPLAQDVFFVSNHLSWLDILVLGGATGTAFISKAELATAPLVGWLADLNRTIYVRRDDRRALPEQIAAVRAAIRGGAVTIFPEGTTGDGVAMLPFKASLFQVLDPPPPGLRVQPVLLDYGPAAPGIAWRGETGAANVRRVLGRSGRLPVLVRCLAPFDPAGMDRKAIAAEARARLEAARAQPAGAAPLRRYDVRRPGPADVS